MLNGGQKPGDDDYYDLSFSGLKTAVLRAVRAAEAGGTLDAERPHLARGFQDALVTTLAEKTAQLLGVWAEKPQAGPANGFSTDRGDFSPERARIVLKDGIGHISRQRERKDPRWGRTEETYGEDPYLVSRMGVACIKALQGKGPGVDGEHVIATAKHYAAHGEPEGGTNIGPANYSERIIREVFHCQPPGHLSESHRLQISRKCA